MFVSFISFFFFSQPATLELVEMTSGIARDFVGIVPYDT